MQRQKTVIKHKNTQKDPLTLVKQHSPYLAGLLEQGFGKMTGHPDRIFADILKNLEKNATSAPDESTLMRLLRLAKKDVAVVTAMADLRQQWDDLAVMRHLSVFADACVRLTLRHLLLTAHGKKIIRLKNPKAPEKDCGVIVIALGKWGAYELNYSSDIDLMVIFDAARANVIDTDATQNFFIRLTRDMARILDQGTEDGYVFRTDLRLRPDPGAMPLAVSIGTAEIYYGSLGQNWERAAMSKARVVTGDNMVADDFRKIMAAWIWRKNLDFAAIQDIHSIKRQINARQKTVGTKDNPFAGYNVKLGHGGIREIEFYAQTQQLIFGGRNPDLRYPDTLSALSALARSGHIEEDTCAELAAAYLFLRRIEHRLQMVDDRQTHSLPTAADAFDDIARFTGYASSTALVDDLEKHTRAVKKLYASLFTDAPSLSAEGNLVFTGVEDDPETIATLKKIGFKTPEKITAGVRGWHHGRYRAMRSERARQLMTELIPPLLKALANTAHPDDAFLRFDAFLSRLPSGVPLLSMFAKNPQQIELVADIMGTSPTLAEALGLHPQVLDGVFSRDFFTHLPTLEGLKSELALRLKAARDYEDRLDTARIWAREKRFHAGVHILKNLSDQRIAAACLADIAEASICELLPYIEEEFARLHGRFGKDKLALVAMGSFSARRMYADSDLDLIALYATDADTRPTASDKKLPPNAYYIRLMQRVISGFGAPTSEGVLYNIDTRLRPAGDDGPLASHIDGYVTYQKKDAWVWEHMSLIRSRMIIGDDKIRKVFDTEKKKILTQKRDAQKLRDDIINMRTRVDREFGSKDPWDLKHVRGGGMDILFTIHYLMLREAHKHPDILMADVQDGIAALMEHKILSKKDGTILQNTLRMADAIQGFLRLCAELPFDAKTAPIPLKNALINHVFPDTPDMTFAAFTKAVAAQCKESYKIYKKVFD